MRRPRQAGVVNAWKTEKKVPYDMQTGLVEETNRTSKPGTTNRD